MPTGATLHWGTAEECGEVRRQELESDDPGPDIFLGLLHQRPGAAPNTDSSREAARGLPLQHAHW